MSTVMVCGSIALDLIGRYPGSFADYQAKYPIQGLNISLQLADLRTSFGGCGLNRGGFTPTWREWPRALTAQCK